MNEKRDAVLFGKRVGCPLNIEAMTESIRLARPRDMVTDSTNPVLWCREAALRGIATSKEVPSEIESKISART